MMAPGCCGGIDSRHLRNNYSSVINNCERGIHTQTLHQHGVCINHGNLTVVFPSFAKTVISFYREGKRNKEGGKENENGITVKQKSSIQICRSGSVFHWISKQSSLLML